ncbi:MAG TPA: epoxyqueuosine reductase [Anaerolineae bacterium]|nr:epoxyqueuosine reductase [Anaerolineae bacterium]
MSRDGDPGTWVASIVKGFCAGPGNTLQTETGERAWGEPLVGFARGDDPLFEQYKEYVGPLHWTPLEAFARAFPEAHASPGELTVISWVLPQTAATRRDNRRQRIYPAERWARSRIFGEAFNNELRKHVADTLRAAGYAAVSPMLLPEWRSTDSERYVYASTWSERHAAYAAGLGTFGLCDGLITPAGKAMRAGSTVARISIDPTPRPYDDHHAYCLHYTHDICGECIDRCPVGAISRQGHDKVRCREHLGSATAPYVEENYGFAGYGCGLCQTGVPCEERIPTPADITR